MSKPAKCSKGVDPAMAGAYVAGLQAAFEIARAALANADKQQNAEVDPMIKRMWFEKATAIAAVMIEREQRIAAVTDNSGMVLTRS